MGAPKEFGKGIVSIWYIGAFIALDRAKTAEDRALPFWAIGIPTVLLAVGFGLYFAYWRLRAKGALFLVIGYAGRILFITFLLSAVLKEAWIAAIFLVISWRLWEDWLKPKRSEEIEIERAFLAPEGTDDKINVFVDLALDVATRDSQIKSTAKSAFIIADSPDIFRSHFDGVALPRLTKAILWDAKFRPLSVLGESHYREAVQICGACEFFQEPTTCLRAGNSGQPVEPEGGCDWFKMIK